jgi:hypothetical protein
MVKVREVKHSDEEVSSSGGEEDQRKQGELETDEEGELEDMDMLMGGEDSSDLEYDEEGESDTIGKDGLAFFDDHAEEGEEEISDG